MREFPEQKRSEIVIEWNGEEYALTKDDIERAFESAGDPDTKMNARMHSDGCEKSIKTVYANSDDLPDSIQRKVSSRLERGLHLLGIQTNKYARLDSKVWIEKRNHTQEREEQNAIERLRCPQERLDGGVSTFYENMTCVNTTQRHRDDPNNLILHLDEATGEFWAVSFAAGEAEATICGGQQTWPEAGPETRTRQEGEKAYEVSLREFRTLEEPLDADAVFDERNSEVLEELGVDAKHILVYDEQFELIDGAYLSEVPVALYELIDETLQEQCGDELPEFPE